MAGTNREQPVISGGPAIILVDPQLGENIGTTARAMLNCGLTDLRLVRPRDGWPSEKARSAASGADQVIDGARLYDSTAEAMADLTRVYATTARQRGMIKRVVTPRRAASEMRKAVAGGNKVGILFGRERSGLENDDIALANAVIAVPLNPAFASLNLAQAVLLVGYEWFQAAEKTPADQLIVNETRPATKAELMNFFTQLEKRLIVSGFLRNEEKRPSMVRNIRNLFQRAGLTHQEVQTLHGIVGDLATLQEKSRKKAAN
ncbi:MAG TPA: RNA methyltransferase [Dongiaceae bacterium]|jgi:tRNA/rRNA methyltransferase|nr:RNA methyltransferase [Dongiaceae bacterium]